MPLIVTGTVGIDTVYTPDHGHRENVLGGSCTYFAAAASFYCKPVRVVAAVGEDFPPELRQTMDRFEGIDHAGLEVRKGSKTFRWGGKYLDNMDQRETLYTDLGVLAEEPPAVPKAFRDSRYVFLANTHPAVQLGLLEQLPQRRLAVADTMDLWIETARPELERLCGLIDGLVLNFDEAEQLTGKRNTVAAARRILDLGPRFVVVKKGEHGCLIVHKDGIAALPAYPTEEVVDPTGAGDSFAGGMMGALAREADADESLDPSAFGAIHRAVAHGTIVASFNIERFSLDRLATLTRAELDERYRRFAGMVRFG
ncbi:MAG: sugar kinase [Phycisphaeraceae bacterium]|nr:sugar kinase [Phycisphaeraceae bacterium]